MRVLQSNVFNETLAKLLLELKDRVNNISPESMRYLPVELVDRARQYVDAEYIFSDNSNINGMDGYKLQSMLRYLKSSRKEFKLLQSTVEIGKDFGNAKSISSDVRIQVSSGWDGRDGIALWGISMLENVARTRTVDASGFDVRITQNNSDIIASIRVPDADVRGAYLPSSIDVYVLLWREKGVR